MRQILVAGNWKMNLLAAAGTSLSQALAAKYPTSAVEILVCPAFPYLSGVAATIQGSAVQLGAQNLYFAPQGAFTGEVCGDMLQDVGCGWVTVLVNLSVDGDLKTDCTARLALPVDADDNPWTRHGEQWKP